MALHHAEEASAPSLPSGHQGQRFLSVACSVLLISQLHAVQGIFATSTDGQNLVEGPGIASRIVQELCAAEPARGSSCPPLYQRSQPVEALALPGQLLAHPDRCGALLQMPKVALLFLVQGPVPHERLWTEWFLSSTDRVSAACTAAAVCSATDPDSATSVVLNACSPEATYNVHHTQHLLSIYVHSPPGWPGYQASSVFHGREVTNRVHTSWASHSVVVATKRLLSAALKDPLNQRFVLVSESCIPLHSPAVMWSQLMADNRSRINACADSGQDLMTWRSNDVLWQSGFNLSHWRKSWQWFALVRKHAELVAQEEVLDSIFEQHCQSVQLCMVEEHLFPSVLAFHGLDSETDCKGTVTWADWDHPQGEGGVHPKSYTPAEVTLAQLQRIRDGPVSQCAGLSDTAASVQATFCSAAQLAAGPCACHMNGTSQSTLEDCPLLARKFMQDTVEGLHNVKSGLLSLT